jgi:hypothetical protein
LELDGKHYALPVIRFQEDKRTEIFSRP